MAAACARPAEPDAADVLGGAAVGIVGALLLTEPRPSGVRVGFALDQHGFRLSYARAFGAR